MTRPPLSDYAIRAIVIVFFGIPVAVVLAWLGWTFLTVAILGLQ